MRINLAACCAKYRSSIGADCLSPADCGLVAVELVAKLAACLGRSGKDIALSAILRAADVASAVECGTACCNQIVGAVLTCQHFTFVVAGDNHSCTSGLADEGTSFAYSSHVAEVDAVHDFGCAVVKGSATDKTADLRACSFHVCLIDAVLQSCVLGITRVHDGSHDSTDIIVACDFAGLVDDKVLDVGALATSCAKEANTVVLCKLSHVEDAMSLTFEDATILVATVFANRTMDDAI